MSAAASGNVDTVLLVDSQFPPEPGSASEARRSLERLSGFLDSSQLDSARLLVSELVSNSIRHAELTPEGWIWLRVVLLDRSLRVEVSDPGIGIPEVRVGPRTDGGWGLQIVDRISDRWGYER